MSNLNFQQGENNSNSQTVNNGNKPDSAWRLIWTGVLVGLVVAAIIGLWQLLHI